MAFFFSIPVFFDHIIGLLREETLFRAPASYTVPTRPCGSQKLNILLHVHRNEETCQADSASSDSNTSGYVRTVNLLQVKDSARIIQRNSRHMLMPLRKIPEVKQGLLNMGKGRRSHHTQRDLGFCLHMCWWRHLCQGRVLPGLPGSLDLS